MISAFLLKPEQYIVEAFGIDKEILLAYSPYDTLQPRALQAVNMLFDIFPFKNRIDTLNCFFIVIISSISSAACSDNDCDFLYSILFSPLDIYLL